MQSDGNKIVIGLVIFGILVISPLWLRVFGDTGARPELEKPKGKKCVESKEFMTKKHMKLLDEWRDAAIREGRRVYVASDKTEYTISLTNTCMKCHTSRKDFCTKCHDYAGVSPYCWDCHLEPTEEK